MFEQFDELVLARLQFALTICDVLPCNVTDFDWCSTRGSRMK
jgi:hypothetical protein